MIVSITVVVEASENKVFVNCWYDIMTVKMDGSSFWCVNVSYPQCTCRCSLEAILSLVSESAL